ncbi:hypothetical protein D5086_032687, partial [Populus alba]
LFCYQLQLSSLSHSGKGILLKTQYHIIRPEGHRRKRRKWFCQRVHFGSMLRRLIKVGSVRFVGIHSPSKLQFCDKLHWSGVQ